MIEGLYFFANLLFITEKRADRKAEVSARRMPSLKSPSTLNRIPKPKITSNPKKTSYQITFLLFIIGSNIEVKNAPVERHARVTEMLETLIALKKVSQCSVIIRPKIRKLKSVF